jgi:hypothetical protein
MGSIDTRPEKVVDSRKPINRFLDGLLRWSIIGGLAFGAGALVNEVEKYKKPEGFVEDSRLERFSEDIDTTGLFYKYAVVNNEATKLYDTDYVYFIYDKDDYTCHEYLSRPILFKDASVIYDLETDRLLAYREFLDGEDINYQSYLDHRDDNYYVPLTEASNYVEGLEVKDYYSLDEIRKLETEIGEGVKVLSKVQ